MLNAGAALLVSATPPPTSYATAPSQPTIVCPPAAAYCPAFEERLADEIERMQPRAALKRAMLDYARLRDRQAHVPNGSSSTNTAIRSDLQDWLHKLEFGCISRERCKPSLR
jgi:hypothetical protein